MVFIGKTSKPMKVYFRVDSSSQIGTGHLMRSLTLAGQLTNRRNEISFISRKLPGNLCDLVESSGYKMHCLPYKVLGQDATKKQTYHVDWATDLKETGSILKEQTPVNWLIIDHYSLDYRWEEQARSFCRNIMVIDDLANRRHDCDVLLDQNLSSNIKSRYDLLVPHHCIKLLGPQYALLRPEFFEERKKLRKRDGKINRILISFGGSDITGETEKALAAIRMISKPDITVDVVAGASNPRKDMIKTTCSSLPNVNFFYQVRNMAQLMSNADLFIGAGGSTTWERCYLGLPSITLVIAPNQSEITNEVAAAGATWNLGPSEQVSAEQFARTIIQAIESPRDLNTMSEKAMNIMGGSSPENDAVTQILMKGSNAKA